MHTRFTRLGLLVALVVALAGLFTAGPAAAAGPSLVGEFWYTPDSALFPSALGPNDPAGCDPTGTSTVPFSGGGEVTGPYPGRLHVEGTYTLGPQTDQGLGESQYGFAAKTGRLESLTGTFTITDAAGAQTVVGTFTGLASALGSIGTNIGSCYGTSESAAFGYTGLNSGALLGLDANVTYQATIDGQSTAGKAIFRQRQTCVNAPSFGGCGSTGPVMNFYAPLDPPAPPSDTEPPAIKVPDTITTSATSPTGAKVDYEVSATDANDGAVSVTCDPASGSSFPVGRTTVACTSKDAAGNTAIASFEVVVKEPQDSDGDGLWDVIEIWLGCNPHKADTDGDGISDRIEILLGTDPTKADSDPSDNQPDDGSLLVNAYGHRCGCGQEDDPDGDGVPTWVELKYGTNPSDPDSDGADPAGGGYSSDLEYVWHLCGCKPIDEDGNGVPSMVEKFYGVSGKVTAREIRRIIHACGCHPWENPNGGGSWIDFRYIGGPSSDTPDDPDGDGIDTVIEIWLGCNPHAADSDGDGLSDTREIDLGTDPTKADSDGDGMNDKREIDLGCNPLDPDSDGDGVQDGADPAPLVKVKLIVDDGRAPVRVGTPVHAALTCTGPATGARIDWGDGATSAGASAVDTARSYAAAGVYTVRGTCTDTTTGSQSETYESVVVYDPAGGFVTGGGFIQSPAGALASDPAWTGKANFGFVSQYKAGATVPDGQTEFQAGALNFHSSGYQWMVISGTATTGYTVQYSGVGTIQGREGTFTFRATLFDGAKTGKPDRFRIRITTADGQAVYDNGVDQPTAGGSIVVHQ
jgi:hypothetical protein